MEWGLGSVCVYSRAELSQVSCSRLTDSSGPSRGQPLHLSWLDQAEERDTRRINITSHGDELRSVLTTNTILVMEQWEGCEIRGVKKACITLHYCARLGLLCHVIIQGRVSKVQSQLSDINLFRLWWHKIREFFFLQISWIVWKNFEDYFIHLRFIDNICSSKYGPAAKVRIRSDVESRPRLRDFFSLTNWEFEHE